MKIRVKFTDQPLGFDPQDNCYIRALRRRYDVELSDEPDLVFYSVFGTDFLNYPGSVRIFLANEPVLPNFNDCDYALGWADLSFGERYFRQPPLTGYGEELFWERLPPQEEVTDAAFHRPFCNFIYSNAVNGEGARLRIEFCRRLARYKHIDCLGPVLNNVPGGIEPRYRRKNSYTAKSLDTGWAAAKLDCLRGYKFTIAFENVSLPGWTTEKLIHPLMAHSVPIYWGNPDAAEYFDPKAFIHCAGYGGDLDAMVEAVIRLDQDQERYMEMLRRPPLSGTFPYGWEDGLTQFLSRIVEKGMHPFPKNPMRYVTAGAQDFGTLCREGRTGMRTIVRTAAQGVAGWLHYKLHEHRE